ncbi:endochitinase A-like [Homarus americanus]|uniref:endochitinase A-like n=1 Tax=Homarus americanus TaxID=6706 RepID=UPI001C4869FB|nr:endochitinase A-like [Homarus americanus]
MYSSYRRHTLQMSEAQQGVSPLVNPPGVCSASPPPTNTTLGERSNTATGQRGTSATGEGGTTRQDKTKGDTPKITVTKSTPVPKTPPSPSPLPASTTTFQFPVILEPSRVKFTTNHPLPLAFQPPPHTPYKGKLPPVASASHMQTVFDSNGVFTITKGSPSDSTNTRPQSVISQQPLTILPLAPDSQGNNNNNNTDTGSKHDRLTLSSSGSDMSRKTVATSPDSVHQDPPHTPVTRKTNCCDRMCDNFSIFCCMLCDCSCCHCDLCCLLCRVCVAM